MRSAARLAEVTLSRCRTLASFSEDAGSLRRTYLSPPMRQVHREIAGWLAALGMTTRIDAVGNLRAVYAGTDQSAPCLLIGSHLDTVPNAGFYDGMLGVVLAIALLEALENRKLPYPIEVVGFSEEEGVRFGIPFIGSRALVGRVDEQLLNNQDAAGASVRKAIEDFGLNPAEIPNAVINNDACAYLEFHIEQGPVLENLGRSLGVVETIAGQTRMDLVFTGRANHAGTTPMDLRFDAMAGAAEWITVVEQTAKSIPGLVATVGSVQTMPGARTMTVDTKTNHVLTMSFEYGPIKPVYPPLAKMARDQPITTPPTPGPAATGGRGGRGPARGPQLPDSFTIVEVGTK